MVELYGGTRESILKISIRESSFNMAKRGTKILRVGSENVKHPKGGASKICILQNQQEGGAAKKLNRWGGGLPELMT